MSKKGRGKRNKEENKEGECQDKLYLCSVSMFICVCNDKITHVSKQVQRKKSRHKWGNIFQVTAQSWSLLLTGKIQSVWSTRILFVLEKVNRNKYFFHSNNLNLCERDKGKENWVHTCSESMCESRENSLLLVLPPPAWRAHRTEIYEGTTSVRVRNASGKHVYHISSQWHAIAVRWRRYRQLVQSPYSGWGSGGRFGSAQALEEHRAAAVCGCQLHVCFSMAQEEWLLAPGVSICFQ